jgi:hypothetical protein
MHGVESFKITDKCCHNTSNCVPRAANGDRIYCYITAGMSVSLLKRFCKEIDQVRFEIHLHFGFHCNVVSGNVAQILVRPSKIKWRNRRLEGDGLPL